MGVRQKVGDGQLVRATRQAITALLAGAGVDLFPPVSCSADQVVTLFGKRPHAMSYGQIAQPQQFWNRHLVRAWQALPALAAGGFAEPALAGLMHA
jgi:hypothetical protein